MPPVDSRNEGLDSSNQKKQAAEVKRAAYQIFESDGYIDMRSIAAVRRATQPLVPRSVPSIDGHGNIPGVNQGDQDTDFRIADDEDATTSDAEDEGGDEVLNSSSDKTKLKLRRSFELVMRTGHVIRFEVSL